jgi:hypothetical protein
MAELPVTIRTIKRLEILKTSLCMLLCLLGSCAASGAGDLSVNGYYKSFFFLFQPASVYGSGQNQSPMALSTNRLRVHLSYQPQNWMVVDAAYDIVPRIQSTGFAENSIFFSRLNPFAYRAVDLDPQIYPSDAASINNFVLNQNLDRAAVAFHLRPADVTVGRQAIAWGSARTINPTDVLAPFTFESLDTEDRIGIDAIRTRIPLGALSEIDTGYVFGKDFKFKNSALYARTKFNVRKTDVALLVMDFRENLLAGFDLARALGGAGCWLETAYVLVDAFAAPTAGPRNNYLRVSTGMDYNFNTKTYGFIEYHFNGAGAALPRDYLNNFSKPAYTEGAVYLMGRHYLIPGITYQLNPLITLTGQSLINLTDPSVFVTPQVEYNIAPNIDLSAGSFIGIGKRPAPSQSVNPLVLHSEFGGYPNFYFGSFRYYF